MAYNLIIIDDFYNNPEEVREFALAQDFDVDGNYPGHRTKSFLTDSIKEYIGEHLEPLHGKILWPEDDNFIDNCFDLPYSKQVNRKQNKKRKEQ